jgi:hypothetical protein
METYFPEKERSGTLYVVQIKLGLKGPIKIGPDE